MSLNFIQDLETLNTTASVVTIGTFDGVHLGHQKIIERLVKKANSKSMKSLVLTFFPHPRMVLQKDSDIKLINTIDEKSELLKQLDIDHLVIKEFTHDFSRLSALEFVRDILVNKLNTKHIIIGYDHHFGRNRTANIDDLKEFGDVYDFEVSEISAQEIDEVAISSTKIRQALTDGDLETANAFLGYHYMLTGTVVKGKGIGKQIDFPTANIVIAETYKLIPKQGAYVVSSLIDGKKVFGMMNIGFNPTVSEDKSQSIEVHFFNFNASIYDKKLQVDVFFRLRDERKFNSVEELKQQLNNDKQNALDYISHKNAQ